VTNTEPFPAPVPGPELSIVVPTFNEADNIGLLVEAVAAAATGIAWELVFVDDHSPDGTAERVRGIARDDARVRIVHRYGRRGLSSACVEGIMSSSAPCCIVMDADFQHDERIIPALFAAIRSGEADLAVGSRYTDGGGFGGWDKRRIAISKLATRLAARLTGTAMTDPMSGFFAVRRDSFMRSLPGLSSIGFKVLLDIAASAPAPLVVVEVPYTFRTRQRGESKLDTLVLWQYIELLIDKTIGRYVSTRFVSFAVVGGLGVAVHFLILTSLYMGLGTSFGVAQTAATVVAISNNFFLNNALTYSDRRLRGRRLFWGWITFNLICATGAAANVGVADYLFARPVNWVLSAFAGILVSVVWNYTISNAVTWRRK